jgi:mono/diheme cytochrome c family protein
MCAFDKKGSIARGIGWAVALVLGAFAFGCSANRKPSQMEEALANMVKDVAIPIQAENLRNPIEPNEKVISEGRQIFGQGCAFCHGVFGRGDSRVGQSMYPPAMDLTSPHASSWTDAELFWIIQNGIQFTGMPAWKEQIGEEDTWKLIHFVRSLAKSAAEPEQQALLMKEAAKPVDPIAYGRLLYRQEGCFMCHQLDGSGGKLGPDLSVEATRNRSDAWLMGHFREPATYTKGSIMPSFKNLTEDQLQALVVFLQSRRGPVAVPADARSRAASGTAARK